MTAISEAPVAEEPPAAAAPSSEEPLASPRRSSFLGAFKNSFRSSRNSNSSTSGDSLQPFRNSTGSSQSGPEASEVGAKVVPKVEAKAVTIDVSPSATLPTVEKIYSPACYPITAVPVAEFGTFVSKLEEPAVVASPPPKATTAAEPPATLSPPTVPSLGLSAKRSSLGVGQVFSAELGGATPSPRSMEALEEKVSEKKRKSETIGSEQPPEPLQRRMSLDQWLAETPDAAPAAAAASPTQPSEPPPPEPKRSGSFLGGLLKRTGSLTKRPRATTEIPATKAEVEEVETRPRGMTLQQQMKAKFDAQVASAEAEAKSNPFSKNFDKGAARLKKGDAGYGTAVAGSATADRAAKAQAWVETEIEKLIEVIKENGDGTTITFGVLFEVYANISDTLVGILMRARKRKRLHFESDMLFQGVHDSVVIRIL